MKRSIKIIRGLILFFLLSSFGCDRRYICECSYSKNGETGTIEYDYSYKENRKDLEEKCEAQNGTAASVSGATVTVTDCTLK